MRTVYLLGLRFCVVARLYLKRKTLPFIVNCELSSHFTLFHLTAHSQWKRLPVIYRYRLKSRGWDITWAKLHLREIASACKQVYNALMLTDGITTKAAAELTGYHQKYIRQLAKGGLIKAERFGRDWMVSKAAILAHKKKMDKQGEKRGPKTGT